MNKFWGWFARANGQAATRLTGWQAKLKIPALTMALKPGSYMPRSGHMHMQQVTGTGDSSHCTTPLLAQPIGADPPPDVQPNLRTAPPSRPHRACHRAAYAPPPPLMLPRARVAERRALSLRRLLPRARGVKPRARRNGGAHRLERIVGDRSKIQRRARAQQLAGAVQLSWTSLDREQSRLEEACGATRQGMDGSRKPAAQRGRGRTAGGSLRRNAAGDGRPERAQLASRASSPKEPRLEKACGATRPGMVGERKPAAQRGRRWTARGSLRRNAAGGRRLERPKLANGASFPKKPPADARPHFALSRS